MPHELADTELAATAAGRAAVLEVDNLHTQIRIRSGLVHAVDGISLRVNAGETVGLVGESGCGKTITSLSIMRLLPVGGRTVNGSVRIGGRDLLTLPESEMRKIRGNDVAMIFQDPMSALNPTMTIGNQIAEAVHLHRAVTRREALARAVEVLTQVGMPQPRERLHYFPHQLSGGLRQRAMIAMALACEPKLLIADEPTTALDVTMQAKILVLLQRLQAELGMGLLLITHDMGVIAGQADRVLVMYAGRVVEQGETLDIFEQPHHPYTEALLASIPQLDQDKTRTLYTIPGTPPDLTAPPAGCRFASRCRYATERCHANDPELTSNGSNRAYACFHPVNSGGRGSSTSGRFAPQRRLLEQTTPTSPLDAPLLELEQLTKEFQVMHGLVRRGTGTVKAVSGVSFAVEHRETFGLVGESGCGKTTIARLLVGLESVTAGRVRFDNTDLTQRHRFRLGNRRSEREFRRSLQLMFQDPYSSLDPKMNVGEILREPLFIQRLGNKKQQRDKIAAMLNEVGLSPRVVEKYPHEFSGGQRQRIGLARALMLEPKLLIADEPVSALDVSIRSQILNLMRELQSRHSLTYIIISHDLSVVRYIADRIGVMYLGKLVEIGPSSDVYAHPAHPYTAGLIDAVPNPNPRRERNKERSTVPGELPSVVDPPSGCRFRTRCPRAADICAETEPLLTRFGDHHQAACHFPLQVPLSKQN